MLGDRFTICLNPYAGQEDPYSESGVSAKKRKNAAPGRVDPHQQNESQLDVSLWYLSSIPKQETKRPHSVETIEITTPHCFVSKSGCSTPNATLLHEVTAQRCIEKKATPALSISNGSSNPPLCRQRYKRPTASAKT